MAPRTQRTVADELAQTSVRFPRRLLKRARLRAVTDEVSFQALVIAAVEAELDRRDKTDARRARRTAKVAATKRKPSTLVHDSRVASP